MGADQHLILVAVVTFALPLAARGLGLDIPARTASRISTTGMLLLLCRSLLTETKVALAAAVVVSGAVTVVGAALVPALRRRRIALALTLVVPALATVLLLAVTSSRGIPFWTVVLVGASTVGWGTGWVIRHAVRAESGHAPAPPSERPARRVGVPSDRVAMLWGSLLLAVPAAALALSAPSGELRTRLERLPARADRLFIVESPPGDDFADPVYDD